MIKAHYGRKQDVVKGQNPPATSENQRAEYPFRQGGGCFRWCNDTGPFPDHAGLTQGPGPLDLRGAGQIISQVMFKRRQNDFGHQLRIGFQPDNPAHAISARHTRISDGLGFLVGLCDLIRCNNGAKGTFEFHQVAPPFIEDIEKPGGNVVFLAVGILL